jgi:outer membrane protein OmpA-like peptidoglycan-associated protein
MKFFVRILIVSLAAVSILGAEEQRKISGRVIDFNSPKNHPIGIDAVKISAFDDKRNCIEQAQTDGEGYYTFKKVSVGDDVFLEYSKQKYLKDPETVPGPLHEATITVTMMKSDGDASYYAATGAVLASRIAGNITHTGIESASAFGIRLEEEWGAFRGYELPFEKRDIVKKQVASTLGPRATGLDLMDATFTLRQLSGTDSEVATAIARQEGLLPDIYFDIDDTTLSFESQQALTKSAKLLGATPDFKLTVEAHADSKGSAEYNAALAERRGETVRVFLSDKGLDAKRINVISYGKERPVCTDKAEECEAKNRRASLVLDTSAAKNKD